MTGADLMTDADLTTGTEVIGPIETPGESPPPILFIAPHQDDELLSMGAAIKAEVATGREVRVLLVGRGNKSVVRTRDMPRLLGRTPSEWEFGRIRDAEFRWSVENLGATPLLPSYVDRLDERAFTSNDVLAYIQTFAPPGGTAVATLTAYAEHNPDHRACAEAASRLYEGGHTAYPPAFFTACSRRAAVEALGHQVVAEGAATPVTPGDQQPYRLTDLATDRWGVGYRSVPYMFDAQLADPLAYRVLAE